MNLRVQCLNFDGKIVTIHDGEGQKDHLQALQELHSKDLEKGYVGVFLVIAIFKKQDVNERIIALTALIITRYIEE